MLMRKARMAADPIRGSPRIDQRGSASHGRATDARRGLTLLEMMLALVVFAVGSVSAMELFHRAQLGSTDGEEVLIAVQLAQRRLEEIRNTAYSSLASESKASVSSPSGFSQFSRQVTVTTPYTNLKQLVVTVSWTAPGGETNVALQTYRSNS